MYLQCDMFLQKTSWNPTKIDRSLRLWHEENWEKVQVVWILSQSTHIVKLGNNQAAENTFASKQILRQKHAHSRLCEFQFHIHEVLKQIKQPIGFVSAIHRSVLARDCWRLG